MPHTHPKKCLGSKEAEGVCAQKGLGSLFAQQDCLDHRASHEGTGTGLHMRLRVPRTCCPAQPWAPCHHATMSKSIVLLGMPSSQMAAIVLVECPLGKWH